MGLVEAVVAVLDDDEGGACAVDGGVGELGLPFPEEALGMDGEETVRAAIELDAAEDAKDVLWTVWRDGC